MVKFHYFDEHSLLALKCKLIELITSNKNWQLWWTFITLMKIHHFDENSSPWWKFITLMKIHQFDTNPSLWWKSITLMKIHHFDENFESLLNYLEILYSAEKFLNLMKIHHFVENSSLWWKFITLLKIYQIDKNWSFWWELIGLMKWITFMNMAHFDKQSHHFDDISSLWWNYNYLMNK